jgi:hypothetical protein
VLEHVVRGTGTRARHRIWGVCAAAALAGCSGSGGEAASPPASLRALVGDRQIAAPGAALPVNARVAVLDARGRPVAGVAIACAVEAGGGSVEPSPTLTDDAGVASCGRWTLGAARGENVLVVTAGTAGPVRFLAAAAQGSPDLSVALSSLGGYPSFVYRVDVASAAGVASLTARAGALPGSVLPLTGHWEVEVLDADGTRILHRSGADGIAVTDSAPGTTTAIGTSAAPGAGFLTPQGAPSSSVPATASTSPSPATPRWTWPAWRSAPSCAATASSSSSGTACTRWCAEPGQLRRGAAPVDGSEVQVHADEPLLVTFRKPAGGGLTAR